MTELSAAPLHGHRGDAVPRPTAPAAMTVAVSREAGARGGSIARRVGKRLGWQVYTHELLEFLCANESARQPVLADLPPDATEWVEAQLDRARQERAFEPDAEGGDMPRLILSLAARGQVVLVGRGAGFYLPHSTSLHVRIVAPPAARVAHMADYYRLTREEAVEQVRQKDEKRADFLLKHFGRRSTDHYDFDLVLNSSLLGEETCADAILAALNGKRDLFEPESVA